MTAAPGASSRSTTSASTETPASTDVETSGVEATVTETSASATEPSPADICEPAIPAMFAYDLATGVLQWSVCSAEEQNAFLVGAANDLAYAIDYPDPATVTDTGTAPPAAAPADGWLGPELIAFDATSGAERWRIELAFGPMLVGSFVGSGVIAATVRDGAGAAQLAGIDAATGTVRWVVPTSPDTHAGAPVAGTETVVVAQDTRRPSAGPPVTVGPDGRPPPQPNRQRYRGYDRATGAVLWSGQVDAPSDREYSMASSATPDAVIVPPGPGALDAATGTQRWSSAVDIGDAGLSPSVDGVVVAGGQDDPVLIALDAATGEMRWEAPALLAYDDSWAIGDSAVFGVDDGNLVGYELAAGAERWRQPVDPAQYLWPRALTGETLLSMWWNLEARSTVDGSLRWSTDYPTGQVPIDDTPRMSSIVTTPTSAIVTFRTSASGGD